MTKTFEADTPVGDRKGLTQSEYVELSDQQRRVYDYLVTGRGLSNLLAITNLSIGSLSSRVAELRKMGLAITSEGRTNPVTAKKYIVYRLAS